MVSRAWATQSSASRWRGLGTPARKLSTSRPTTSGAAPNSNGPTSAPRPPAAATSTSTSSDNASGWPCESSSIHPCCSSATPAPRRKARASSGPRLRSETTRSRSPHPGSRRHARPGTVPARHDDQRTRRQRRDELLAQPVLEPDRSLERVQQQHRGSRPASASRADASRAARARAPSSAMNAGGEGSIARRSRLTTRTPASAAASASAPQQRGLANPARTVHPQHAERRFRTQRAPPGTARAPPRVPRTAAAAHSSSGRPPSTPAAARTSLAALSGTSCPTAA